MSHFSTIPMGTYSVKPQTGFTQGLMETIAASKNKLEKWVEFEKAKADKVAEMHKRMMEDEQAKIDNKVSTLLALQLERGLNVESDEQASESIATRTTALEEKRVFLENEIKTLGDNHKIRKERVGEITQEESKLRARAQEARNLKQQVEEAKKTTIDDLTRGIVNYKYLGLDFEQTDGENELRFTFTKLDPENPSKEFSFILLVNNEDKYEVSNCSPPVDATKLVEIADEINQSEDMARLVQRMRREFLETI